MILADDAKQDGDGGGFTRYLPFFLLIIVALYFFIVILPGRRRQEKERQAMLTNLNKNDEVLTVAGIYGTVVSVHETKDEVTIKVDDGTRLRMTKGSIMRNFTKEEAAKAPKEQPKS
jgi:preprotein translocase subunit YajC